VNITRKYTVKYSGYREVFAESEEQAREECYSCMLSVFQSLETDGVTDEGEVCADCECNPCECGAQ
jgi:hypothetical protein